MDKQEQDDQTYSQLADQLEALGYFRYAAPERIPHWKSVFAKKRNIWNASVKRDFPADEAAIYGVKDLLRKIPARVRKEILPLKKMRENLTHEGHWIVANDQRYDLVLKAELEGLTSKFGIWRIKTPRSLAFINKLFQDAGSEQRIYSLAGGNDHWVFILPQSVYDLFIEYQIEGANELKMYKSADYFP
jgi:hypothetical protein